ncbi:hypothetical protein TNCV_5089931 [Trichonephila clavipes]|nr:hypothetical protein TNCV_5089931 [Trichonephila clavipes]
MFYAWPNYWTDRRRAKNNRRCQEFDTAHSVVSRLWKSIKTTGMCSRRTGKSCLKYDTLQKTDIVLSAKGTGAPHSSTRMANQFLAASGKQISRKNCCQTRLRGGGHYIQTCCVCPIDQTAPYCRLMVS